VLLRYRLCLRVVGSSPAGVRGQGDQIGRIFAKWATVYFGPFVKKNTTEALIFGQLLSIVRVCNVLILTKNGSVMFLAIFSRTHLVTLYVQGH
jgi:hypothetical protein